MEQFKELLKKYPIELKGAGIGDSPIIKLDSSPCVKGVIAAHDLKEIRECDILLVVITPKSQAVATFMELEYARQLGLYIIVLTLPEIDHVHKGVRFTSEPCKVNSIFLQTYANLIIYSIEELEGILKELTDVKDED